MFLTIVLCFVQQFNLTGLVNVDPYQTLGLEKGFTDKQLHRAYRRYISEKLHNTNPSPRRQRQLKEVEFALHVLANPSARTLYEKDGFGFLEHTDFQVVGYASDIQLALVQRVYGQIPVEMVKNGGTIFYPVEFSLLDFYQGAKKTIYLSGLELCVCKKGKGQRCAKCRDNPFFEKVTKFTFELPAGASNFYIAYAENVYDEGMERAPHDIVFVATCNDDTEYRRMGNDIVVNQTISVSEAIRGKSVEVVNIDDASIDVPIGSTIGRNSVVHVPGKGFPFVGEETRGDMVVNFEIAFPEKLSDSQRSELMRLLPEDPAKYE